jgi:hypothetical protein
LAGAIAAAGPCHGGPPPADRASDAILRAGPAENGISENAVLQDLDSNSWMVVSVAVVFGAFWLGWIADMILDTAGLGVLLNWLLATLGAFGGIYGFDFALRNHHVPLAYADGFVWVAAAIASGTLALLSWLLVRAVIRLL